MYLHHNPPPYLVAHGELPCVHRDCRTLISNFLTYKYLASELSCLKYAQVWTYDIQMPVWFRVVIAWIYV